MARIDSILNIVAQQNADELRIGTDRAPRMFAAGVPKRLALPETPDEMMRHLLGPLLTPEREAQLRAGAKVDFTYAAEGIGGFLVTLTARARASTNTPDANAENEAFVFDAVFTKGARASAPPPPTPTPTPPAAAAPPIAEPAVATAPVAAYAAAPGPPPLPMPRDERDREGAVTAGADLAALLAQAAAVRASDVHLMTGEAPVIRVDGRVRTLTDAPADVEMLLATSLTRAARDRIADGQSADLGLSVDGVGRFRVNVYRASAGLAAAIRVLPRFAPSLADLRLPVSLHDIAELPNGLVILCGPTGSGKSTTLAALAQEVLRRRAAMLLTLEDPIEYTLDSRGARGVVRQRQLGRDVRDFPTGLRDALREDPDVLLIGEMRDAESISLALTAAETGHLVLTSLHSRSAGSAVERIVDTYPAGRQSQVRAQLADSLRAVIAQRLVPRARSGGRAAPLEVLRGTQNVAAIIRDGKTQQLASAIQSGRKDGMVPLERTLADMCKTGEISVEEARAVCNDLASLTSYLNMS